MALIFWSVLFIINVLNVTFMIRNQLVFKYRGHLIDQIGICADRDIQLHQPFQWRYEVLSSVGYHKMVYQFWRRLGSFFPDKSFLLLPE